MSEPIAVDLRRPWANVPLAALLDASELDGLAEVPFANDGWSGSELTLIDRGDRRFILKRTSAARAWIRPGRPASTVPGSGWPARIWGLPRTEAARRS